MTKDTNFYPIFLNLRGRRALVVGGGAVALRKVNALLECGARVEAVSPEFCPELEDLAGGSHVTLHRRSYRVGDLAGASLAVAATDDGAVNSAIAREGRERGVLVNVVDDLAASDFIVPSYFRRGPVTVAVSTSGSSPALARKMRTRLEEVFGEDWSLVAALVHEVRCDLSQKGIAVSSDLWQESLDLDRLGAMVRAGRTSEAKQLLLNRLDQSSERKSSHTRHG